MGSRLGGGLRARLQRRYRGRSEVHSPEEQRPWGGRRRLAGPVLRRPRWGSLDRLHPGVVDGGGRARRGRRGIGRQGGRGVPARARPKGRADGFLGTEQVFAGCSTEAARPTVRGVVMCGIYGPDTDSRCLTPPARSTNSRSLLPEPALWARCLAAGSATRNDPATNRRRQLAANPAAQNEWALEDSNLRPQPCEGCAKGL